MTLAGEILILLGAILFTTASLGILRFPDAYTRVSAVGTAGGLGITLLFFGAFLVMPSWWTGILTVGIILLQLITSAVGSSATARSAYLIGIPMQRASFDELRDDEDNEN